MREDFCSCLSYYLSKMLSSKPLPNISEVSFPSLIERLEVVVVQLHVQQVVQIHRMPMGLVDAEEREDLVDNFVFL